MKTFKTFLSESWKKKRKMMAYKKQLMRDAIRSVNDPESPKEKLIGDIVNSDNNEDSPLHATTNEYGDLIFKYRKGTGHTRDDVGTQFDRKTNKRLYRLHQTMIKQDRRGEIIDPNLMDRGISAMIRDQGRTQFRGAKLRGQKPGPGYEDFLTKDSLFHNAEEAQKNIDAFSTHASHRELVGTSIDNLARNRDWYRFHNMRLRGHNNSRIQKFLNNLHRSGRIVQSTI